MTPDDTLPGCKLRYCRRSTDRHALLLASLGFSHFLDGAGINGFQARLLLLHLLLTDGRRRPATTKTFPLNFDLNAGRLSAQKRCC